MKQITDELLQHNIPPVFKGIISRYIAMAYAAGYDYQRGERNMKPVQKLNALGTVIAEYVSVISAARHNNIDKSGIYSVCTGRKHTCGGFIWKYTAP